MTKYITAVVKFSPSSLTIFSKTCREAFRTLILSSLERRRSIDITPKLSSKATTTTNDTSLQ